MNRFALCLSAATLAIAGAAHAENVTATFPIPMVGIALNYGSFGYTPDGGEYTVLTGAEIISSEVSFEFTPETGVDVSDLLVAMVVPVEGAVSEYFAFTGDELTETSPGKYSYKLTTNDHNGIIRPGRFSIETYGLDDEGNPVSLPGVVSGDSAFVFTVAVPEPASLSALAGGALLVGRRRR
jgi:hypothetical protein